MSIVNSAGSILTKTELVALAEEVAQPTVYRFTENIYETFSYPGAKDHEGGRRLLFREGEEITEDKLDAMYAASVASFTSITPAVGDVAGGTAVTIVGKGFSGAEGATLGGIALTNFKVVSDTKITGTTGAHAAGAVNLVIQDASGNVTANNAFTYEE